MQTELTIKRRVRQGKKYVEQTEKAILIGKKATSVMVRLKNGDEIKRKNRDVIWEK